MTHFFVAYLFECNASTRLTVNKASWSLSYLIYRKSDVQRNNLCKMMLFFFLLFSFGVFLRTQVLQVCWCLICSSGSQLTHSLCLCFMTDVLGKGWKRGTWKVVMVTQWDDSLWIQVHQLKLWIKDVNFVLLSLYFTSSLTIYPEPCAVRIQPKSLNTNLFLLV